MGICNCLIALQFPWVLLSGPFGMRTHGSSCSWWNRVIISLRVTLCCQDWEDIVLCAFLANSVCSHRNLSLLSAGISSVSVWFPNELSSVLMDPASFLCASIYTGYLFLVTLSGVCQLYLPRQLSSPLTLVLAMHQNCTWILVQAIKSLLRDGDSTPLLSFLRFFRHWEKHKIFSSVPIVRPTNGISHDHQVAPDLQVFGVLHGDLHVCGKQNMWVARRQREWWFLIRTLLVETAVQNGGREPLVCTVNFWGCHVWLTFHPWARRSRHAVRFLVLDVPLCQNTGVAVIGKSSWNISAAKLLSLNHFGETRLLAVGVGRNPQARSVPDSVWIWGKSVYVLGLRASTWTLRGFFLPINDDFVMV